MILYFREFPENYLTDAARDLLSLSSIYCSLKLNKYHPWKLASLRGLKPNHANSRVLWSKFRSAHGKNALHKILWTDKSYFGTAALVYLVAKTTTIRPAKTRMPRWQLKNKVLKSVNMWWDTLARQIIGPYVFECNMNTNKYFKFL